MTSYTSDERREVAERLREDASCSENSPREVVESYLGIEYDGSDVMEESYTSESLLRLADLIDPTCHLVMVEDCDGDLTEVHDCCGDKHTRDAFTGRVLPYCPDCGARVVSGDGLD